MLLLHRIRQKQHVLFRAILVPKLASFFQGF
jgi:hypothetical protein